MKQLATSDIYSERSVRLDDGTEHWSIRISFSNIDFLINLINLLVASDYVLDYQIKTGVKIDMKYNADSETWKIRIRKALYSMRMIDDEFYIAVGAYSDIPPMKKYVEYVCNRCIKMEDGLRRKNCVRV